MSVLRYLIEEKHADPTLRTVDGLTAADLHHRRQSPSAAAYLRDKEQMAMRQANERKREKQRQQQQR